MAPFRRRYRYVGPPDLLNLLALDLAVAELRSPDALTRWLDRLDLGELDEPLTFVVTTDGYLRLAPRRSEHVHCAGGKDVLAAGEISFTRVGQQVRVSEVSNQSTGYCPDPDSWPAVAEALDRAGLDRPPGFTSEVIFRRCLACQARNIVHDAQFLCAICDAALPADWNFGDGDRG